MNNKFWRIYKYISIPLTIITIIAIVYFIYIDDKPNLIILLPFTLVVIFMTFLSIRIFINQKKNDF